MEETVDYIIIEHECPQCTILAPFYKTDKLTGTSKHFYLGDKINLSHKQDFEFRIFDSCNPCNISIEGLGIVKDNILVEIKELGYFKPVIHYSNPIITPRYFNIFNKKIKIGHNKSYQQHQQFTQLEKTIAKLTK